MLNGASAARIFHSKPFIVIAGTVQLGLPLYYRLAIHLYGLITLTDSA